MGLMPIWARNGFSGKIVPFKAGSVANLRSQNASQLEHLTRIFNAEVGDFDQGSVVDLCSSNNHETTPLRRH